jgi:hypothetical protein
MSHTAETSVALKQLSQQYVQGLDLTSLKTSTPIHLRALHLYTPSRRAGIQTQPLPEDTLIYHDMENDYLLDMEDIGNAVA